MYILLCGKPPFDGDDDDAIKKKVLTGIYDMEKGTWQHVSKDAKDLISKMMNTDLSARFSAKQALQHTWFQNVTETQVDPSLLEQTLGQLLKFNATQKLQQATMSMMVQNMVTKEEVARLQKVFVQLDKNKDGKLQYEEVLEGYEEFYGAFAKEEVDRIFALVDVDKSGEIDFSEFVTATVNRGDLLKEEKLKAAFDLYDKD